MTEKQRRKTRTERKEDIVKVRVTAEQKRLFADAAARAGLDVSGWLRSLGIREARVGVVRASATGWTGGEGDA